MICMLRGALLIRPHPSVVNPALEATPPSLVVTVHAMKHKSSTMPLDGDVESEEEKDLLVKHKRTKFSRSIFQPQQGTEVSDMANKVPDVLSLEVPAGKDPMDGLTGCGVQSSVEANGCRKGHVQHVNGISFTDNESARSRLPKICTTMGWKEPSYDFEEQGPPHNKLFTCKVTVHVDGIVNTVMECFGDPKHQMKAAQEHAAQGALWCLQRYGHVK